MINKLACIITFSLVAMAPLFAEDHAKAELSGGYLYSHTNSNGSFNFNGGTGAFTYNLNRTWGAVAEITGSHNGPLSATSVTYLFGPQVSVGTTNQFMPFAHALFGGMRFTIPTLPQNAFAVAFGGGIDAKLSEHWAWRVAQVDYMHSRNSLGSLNWARVSSGVVFRFVGR